MFLVVFPKNEYFWGYDEIVDNFQGSSQSGLFWRSFHYTLGHFLKVNVENLNIFLGVANFQILLGVCLIILICFFFCFVFCFVFFWGGGGKQ